MKEIEVVDLTIVAQSFPSEPKPEIPRDNFLETIDRMFNSGIQVVAIEGEDGIGKTNFLSQFVKQHPLNAFSIFITSNCIWGYDPYLIKKDLFEQIKWAIEPQEKEVSESVSDSDFGTCFFALRKKAKRERTIYYFVIDGLSDIPKERMDIQEEILNWLPLSFNQFRFLFSGELIKTKSDHFIKLSFKSFPLTGFTLSETKTYFEDLTDEIQSINEIHKICKGIPGYLESVRRIIIDGKGIKNLLDNMPEQLPGLFELEWEKVQNDENYLILLAIVAHGRWQHTVEDLAEILNIGSEQISKFLSKLPFISLDSKSHEITFVSDIFRKFAISQLKEYKKKATEILIDSLLKKGDRTLSYKYLPTLYQELGRSDELLSYLSSEQADRLVDHFKSILPLQQKAAMGVSTSLRLNRMEDLAKFSMQSSALKSLWKTKILHSEIEALMALDRYDAAINLAHSNVINEEKLQLLCLLAKSKTEKGLSPDEDLIEQIKELYSNVDFEILGDDAIDIASSLIYSVPELAIDLIENTNKRSSRKNNKDWGYTRLSFAILNDSSKKKIKFDAIEKIKQNITSPETIDFYTGLSLMLGEYSSQKVISESEKIKNPDDQLFLLRHWTLENKYRDDAKEVIEFALDLILKSATISPTAQILAELSAPIPNLKNPIKIKSLVGKFDIFIDTARKLGPTKDYVNLQLLLADAESKYDLVSAGKRVVEIYNFTNGIDDLLIKIECQVDISVVLKRIDAFLTIEENHKICSSIQKNINPQIENLLITTADHYEVTKDVIKSLTKTDPNRAIDLALQLNTLDRRDHALFEFIKNALKRRSTDINLISIDSAISHIRDKDAYDLCIYEIVERYSKASHDNVSSQLLFYIQKTQEISNSSLRCKALSYAYIILTHDRSGKTSNFSSGILESLKKSWEQIDVEWEQIDTGFKIVKILSTSSIELSQEFLLALENKRKNIHIDSGSIATPYINFIRLAIRSLSGLMPKKIVSQEDLYDLAGLIERIDSRGVRANLWSELAIRYFINGDQDNCKKLVTEKIRPLLISISMESLNDRIESIIECSPALYCAHKNSAFEIINTLPSFEKDYAYYQICRFLMINHPLSDPFDEGAVLKRVIDYEKLLDLCELIDKMGHDGLIFSTIRDISEQMKIRKRHNTLSKEQQDNIIKNLTEYISTKFPNLDYIKHDGYKLVSKAQILSIQKTEMQEWDNLIQEALKIPNRSDMGFVLLFIAVCLPQKFAAKC